MELASKFELEFNLLKQAVQSFDKSLQATFTNFGDIGDDLIKNGRIQKFEYTTEYRGRFVKYMSN